VFRQLWPKWDDALAQEDTLEIPVQVNGKLRTRIAVPLGTSQADLEKIAQADPKVQPFIEGKTVAKVIVVPEKLVNIVVK
jgi:leucyl-tRNA synthetase